MTEIYTYSKKKTKFFLKHADIPCSTCGTKGRPVFGPRNLDEMIENFVEVGYNFRNYQTLWNKLKQGTASANGAMREGTQHTLEIFRKNATKYAPSKIEDLDMKFENLAENVDLCLNSRYDVKFKEQYVGNGTPLLAEFKSYATATWQGIKNSPKSIQQFKNYLATTDITTIDKLAYVVNITKATEAEIKLAFKELFLAKKDEIFAAMNPQLKLSLSISEVDDLTPTKIDQIINSIVKTE